MNLYENIKSLRAAKGVSQAEIARRLELDPSAYHRLEHRGNKLSIEQAESIATALGVSLLELLTWGNIKAEPETKDLNQADLRIKELTDQVKLYSRFLDIKEEQQKEVRDSLILLVINEIWDTAYTSKIMSEEEAKRFGVMFNDWQALWNEDIYVKNHPNPFELLTEDQLYEVYEVLFRQRWFRFLMRNKLFDQRIIKLYDEWIEPYIVTFKRPTFGKE